MSSKFSSTSVLFAAVALSTAAVFAVPVNNNTTHEASESAKSSLVNLLIHRSSPLPSDVTGEGIDGGNHTNSTRPQGRSLFPGTFGNTGLPSEVLTLLARAHEEAEEDKVIDGIIDSMFPEMASTPMRFDGLPVAPAGNEQSANAVVMGSLQPQMAAINQQVQLMRMAPMMNLLRAADQMNALKALSMTRLPPTDLATMMMQHGMLNQKNAVETRQGGCGNKRIDTRFGNKGYMFSWLSPGAPRLDGNSARAFCRSQCMDLVSLESEAENQFIKSIVDQAWRQGVIQYIWTSGSRSGGGFVWGSGVPIPGVGQPGSNWGIRQPDNREGAENCMALLNPSVYNDPSGQFTWHDISCHYQKPFVCEEI